MEFIADFGTMKAFVEVMEAARTNHSVFTLKRDAPPDALSLSITHVYLSDQFTCIVQRSMRLVSIELHSFLVRKYRKECLRIIRLDVPKQQPIRSETRKLCKHRINAHEAANLLRMVVIMLIGIVRNDGNE